MATISENVGATLTRMVQEGQPFDTMNKLNDGLRLLAKWRSVVIANKPSLLSPAKRPVCAP